jgi:hypothetical protein
MVDDVGTFGLLLRTHRRSAGMSQDELAERSGLSSHAISGLECGRTRVPYPNSVHRLADALDLYDQNRAAFLDAAGRRLAPVTAAPDVPSPRSGNGLVVPRQLPGAVPAFVGRPEQLAALSRALCQSQVPGETADSALIAVISGVAGVGKTALAVHWAHQVAGQYPDGQLFINLRGFAPDRPPVTPGEAVRVFLEALEIPASRIPLAADARLGLYRSLLAGRRLLIVLDDAHDAAQVRPLLPGGPGCRIVITSRRQLTGLAAIDAAWPLRLDLLTSTEVRQMLRRRIGADLIASDAASAAAIARWCGRLPLALSVIAARLATQPQLTLAALAADLTDTSRRLDVLHTASDPLASVRVALARSYDHLDAGPARTFRLLGMHPGPGISLAAAASLAGLSHSHVRRHLPGFRS